MKKSITVLIFICLPFFLFSQRQTNDVRFDTIKRKFIIELNARFIFYSNNDAIIQNNLMFPFSQFCKGRDGNLIYKSDSVFLTNCEMTKEGCQYKKYVDQVSVSNFYNSFDTKFIKQSQKILFAKSQVVTKEGAKYCVFEARVICINLGKGDLNIPKIYSANKKAKDNKKYESKTFNNCYLITKVIDFHYVKQ